MKKTLIVLIALAALTFAGCSNDSDSPEDTVNTGKNSTGKTTEQSDEEKKQSGSFTLSFDANYPFDTSYEYNSKTKVATYASQFIENGNTYFYQATYAGKPQSALKDISSTTLSESPYTYEKAILLSTDGLSYRTTRTFKFDHYNTKADDKGTTYRKGDTIELFQDTILYCFYVDTAESEGKKLDFTKITSYSMKIGETVEIARYFNDLYDVYLEVTSGNDIISLSNSKIEAVSIGTATVKATDWDDREKQWYCRITVTADGFIGKPLEYKLLGTWKYNGSSSNGMIVLNTDMTGYISAKVNSTTVHDNYFTWSAYETTVSGKNYQFLKITGTGVSTLDGEHQITNVTSSSFKMKGYLAFGMPQETTWNKQ